MTMICLLCLLLLSSAAQKDAPLKKNFSKKRTPKLLKETWFDEKGKSLLRERQAKYENYNLILSPED